MVMRQIVRYEATAAMGDFDIANLQPGESLRFTRTQVGQHAPVYRAEANRLQTTMVPLEAPPPPAQRFEPFEPDMPRLTQRTVSFNLLQAMYGIDNPDDSWAYWPMTQEALRRYRITAQQMYDVMHALEAYTHTGQLDTLSFDTDLRHRALSVQIAVSGLAGLEPPAVIIAQGRSVPWTRLTLFLGDGTLSALAGLGLVGTTAAAACMTAMAAGSQVAGLKSAAGVTAKLKTAVSAVGYGVGATAAGVLTTIAGVATFGYWHDCIQAYRDVWDSEVGRDAYLCHRLKVHGVVPGQVADICNHADGAFTSPNVLLAAHLIGRRRN